MCTARVVKVPLLLRLPQWLVVCARPSLPPCSFPSLCAGSEGGGEGGGSPKQPWGMVKGGKQTDPPLPSFAPTSDSVAMPCAVSVRGTTFCCEQRR